MENPIYSYSISISPSKHQPIRSDRISLDLNIHELFWRKPGALLVKLKMKQILRIKSSFLNLRILKESLDIEVKQNLSVVSE